MADVVERLLGALAPDAPGPGADVLPALAKVEASDAPAIASYLGEAAQRDLVHVLLAAHILTLLNAPLAQAVLNHGGFLRILLEKAQSRDAACAAGHMLAGAASHAPLRAELAQQPTVREWLARHAPDAPIVEVGDDAAACALLVRIKLAIGTDASAASLALDEDTCRRLFPPLRETVVRAAAAADPGLLRWDAAAAARADALEGLYYLVKLPALRDVLCDDRELLETLVRLLLAKETGVGVPARSSLAFVIVSIFSLAAGYAPPRTEEQRRVEALRRSAARGAGEAAVAPADAARRARALVDAGAVPPLVALALRARAPADRELRRVLSALLLALVTEQDTRLRGRLLQLGVGRAVLALCADAYAAAAERAAGADLAPLQALAKLGISTDPTLLFRQDGAAEQGVRYLAALYFAPEASLLQLFEATMAFTNLASVGAELAGAVARAAPAAPGSEHADIAHSLVSYFLLHDEPMVRRALVELLCNLVQDERVFAEWSGDAEDAQRGGGLVEGDEYSEPPDAEASGAVALRLHTARGRLQLLVSLSALEGAVDAGAVALALAASGTLATLTSAPAACARLLDARTDVVLASLVMPECTLSLLDAQQLALRGVVVAANLVQFARTRAGADARAVVARVRGARVLAACGAYVAENAPHAAQRTGEPRLASLRQQALTMGVDVLREAQRLV